MSLRVGYMFRVNIELIGKVPYCGCRNIVATTC